MLSIAALLFIVRPIKPRDPTELLKTISIYLSIYRSISLSLSLYIYIHIYIYIYMYV